MNHLEELVALEQQDDFVSRHIGPTALQITAMLKQLGLQSIDGLIAQTIPANIRTNAPLALPEAEGEAALLHHLRGLASQNVVKKSFIGLGYYGTHTPSVIQRNVLENPGWYTAYTPYQAEISQGRLEAVLNFQTMVTSLTGMEIANASLLDEATAAAEGVAMACGLHKAGSKVIAVATDVLPQTRAVIATRAWPLGWEIVDVKPGDVAAITAAKPFALVLNYPGATGEVRDLTAEIAAVKTVGGMSVVCADLLALTLLTPPGEMGADIVVGSAQRFGVPMGFGGPHAGFFATRDAFKRAMPGRLVGVSVDAAGKPAMRLALQTREQHIRREKATSNICTAQVLLAVMAGFYAVWHGAEGLKTIAKRVNLQARLLASLIQKAGFKLLHTAFFDTLTIEVGDKADTLLQKADLAGFNLRCVDTTHIAIALDETLTRAELEALAALFGGSLKAASAQVSIPESLVRQSVFCTEDVFNSYHSEHGLLRYLKRLEDKDIALNRSMIPLGSCTMKLNAAVEMAAITWPEFTNLHPFAPAEQTKGMKQLIDELASLLCEVTGFAAVSLQPNSGAQGEYAGLLAIRAYHEARGQGHRNICLIPASAHGTNPASAAMAGYKVVVVACDRQGNVDTADLNQKIATHANDLAALMITYPSTHGVYETSIRDIAQAVHEAGGQVYMDGANMNAQVGLTSPANIGADVCHLNLHKTFCIPHGGGGPGVGPIGVAAHLAPHLPNHPLRGDAGPQTGYGPVSAAPFGSALILPIPYAYIRLMGPQGITHATKVAILNANYIATRLQEAYPILYRGAEGRVAHECIVDCRDFAAQSGVQVEDIAKRLADYGFHAPTMSWPVAGTLMIEPTESEGQGELDRFCAAMLSIAAEIKQIEAGVWPKDDNPLKNAPHTVDEVIKTEWAYPYSRQVAAFPLPYVAAQKYWPSVKRVDNVYGDRNLVCSCAPLEAYQEAAE